MYTLPSSPYEQVWMHTRRPREHRTCPICLLYVDLCTDLWLALATAMCHEPFLQRCKALRTLFPTRHHASMCMLYSVRRGRQKSRMLPLLYPAFMLVLCESSRITTHKVCGISGALESHLKELSNAPTSVVEHPMAVGYGPMEHVSSTFGSSSGGDVRETR